MTTYASIRQRAAVHSPDLGANDRAVLLAEVDRLSEKVRELEEYVCETAALINGARNTLCELHKIACSAGDVTTMDTLDAVIADLDNLR